MGPFAKIASSLDSTLSPSKVADGRELVSESIRREHLHSNGIILGSVKNIIAGYPAGFLGRGERVGARFRGPLSLGGPFLGPPPRR